MNGANLNYEQKFFIENYEVSGVVSIDGGYQINEEPLNVLGHGYFDSLVNAPLQGNFSIERSLITRDPLLNYTGEEGFNGGIYYNGTSFDFVSGYLEDYSVSCSVGSIPSVSSQIAVFGNIGGRSRTLEQNKIKNYNTTLHHTETGIIKQYVETGILTTGIVRDTDVVKLSAVEWLDYGWLPLSGDHPIPSTEFLKPEEEGEIIQIPDQGSIFISGFGTETNRVQSFSYSLSTPREPIYAVGRDRPVEVQTIPPYEVNAEINLHIDDYEAKNVFDYLIQEKSPHKKDLTILVMNSEQTSAIGSYNIPNARLISENITASADEQLEITLSYRGYYNFLDESIISGNLLFGGADEINIGPEPDREFECPSIPTFKPQSKPATNHTQYCFTLNWKGHVIDHSYELDVSKEDISFNLQNKVLDRFPFASDGNEQIIYSYELCNLDPGTVYYYRIRSKNANGEVSAWSNVVQTITIPANPTINSFSDCQDNPNFGFRLNWSNSKGATHYLLDISEDPNFRTFYKNLANVNFQSFRVNENNYLVENLEAGTVFYSRVRAINSVGSSFNSLTFKNHTRPPKPTNIQFSNILGTSFVISWNESILNEGYMVSVFPLGSSSPIAGYNRKKTQQTTMQVSGLDVGSSYSVVIHVENDCGETSGTSPSVVSLIPAKVSTITASQCTFYGFSISWPSVNGAIDYEVQYTYQVDSSNNPVFNVTKTTSSNSYVISELLAGTKYYYRVRARNTTGNGDYSEIFNKTTIPPKPVLIESHTTDQSSILISWNPTSGADSYEVDVSLESNAFTPNLMGYSSLSTTATSLKVEGLSAGNNYVYRVRAVNDCGISQNSLTGTDCTAPPTPTNLSVSSLTPSSFNVSWNSVGAGIKYIFDLSKSESMSPSIEGYAEVELSSPNITLSNLEEGTVYYFRARSTDGDCGVSPYSSTFSEITPSNSSLKGINDPSNCTYFGFTASWNSDPSSTAYEFNLSTSSNFSSFVDSFDTSYRTTSNSLVLSSLTPGTKYYYRIKAYNQYGSSEYSDSKQAIVFPNPPTLSSSNVSSDSFKISLSQPTSATSYEIDVSTSSNFSSFLTGFRSREIFNNSIIINGLSPSTRYYIRSRAKNTGCGLSQNSATLDVTTASMPSKPSTPSSSDCSYFGIKLSWSAAANASEYNLVLSKDSNFSSFESGFDESYMISTTSATLSNLDPGQLYYYKIRSKNNFGLSNFSSFGTFLTFPSAPAFQVTSTSINSISLSWSAVLSAKRYYIYYAEKNGDSLGSYTEKETTATSYTISGLKSDQEYSIYMTSENDGCGESQDSNIFISKTNSVPSSVSGLSKSNCFIGGFKVSWTDLPSADYYKVSLFTGGVLSRFINVYSNSATFSNLEEGISYDVKVQSGNEHGLSGLSDPLTIVTKPPAPSNVQISSFTDTSISTSWTSSRSATSYIAEISSDLNFSSIIETKETSSTSYTFSNGIEQDNTYYIRVRAENSSCGEGSNSTAIIITTNSSTPGSIENIQTSDCTSSANSSGFTISWNESANTTSYELNISTSSSFSNFVDGYDTSNSTLGTLIESTRSVVINGLEGGTKYYFRIRAKNKDGSSAYSATENISTIPNKVNDLSQTDIGCDGCVDISWSAAAEVDNYKLYVSTDSGYSNTVTNYGPKTIPSTSTSEEICGLSSGTNYYIKILASNGCGDSEASEIEVTTNPSVPTTRESTQITSSTFTANWSYPSGTSYFKFYLSENPDMSNPLSSYNGIQTFTNSISVDGLTQNKYYFRVQAYSSLNAHCGDSDIRVTTMSLSPVTASAASSNATDCSVQDSTLIASFTINWVSISTADGYYIDLSESAQFSSFVTATSGGSEIYLQGHRVEGAAINSLSVSNLSSGKLYYYRIRSYNDQGESLSSNVVPVLTIPARPVFTTTSNTSGSSVTLNIVPTFSENLSSSRTSVSNYNVKVYSDSSLNNEILDEDITNSTSVVVDNLSGGQSYFATATASNTSGSSCVSASFEFTTSKSLLQENEDSILQQNNDIILLEENN